MGLLGLLGAVVVTMFVTGIVQTGRGRIRAHGLLILLWRWHTGQPWHGKPVTDRGWFRPASKVLTRTGHAPRFHHRTRWQQTVMRTSPTLLVVLAGWGWYENPRATKTFLLLGLVASLCWAGWRTAAGLRSRRHRTTWVDPVHMTVAPLAGIPLADKPGSWLQIEADATKAVTSAKLTMPFGFEPDPKHEERIVRAAAAKLGLESPDAAWRRAVGQTTLTLTRSQPPPLLVTWDDVAAEVARCRPDELVAGIGKRGKLIKVSLNNDSPHFIISMGSGAGKSRLAAFLLLQVLMRGGIALILDAKWISHPWLMDLPSVAYARTPAQLHNAMCWLGDEVARRNEVAFRGMDYGGRMHAKVGARLMVVAEELNLAEAPLKNYWTDIRDRDDPKRSPAFDGLAAGSFAGRQVLINELLIGQMVTVAVTGKNDSSVKANCGVKFMARYEQPQWKAMTSMPMPPVPTALGRVQIITAAGVRETQVPLVGFEQARELVLAGTVTPCPAGMPYVGRVTDTGHPAIKGSDQVFVTSPGPAGNGSGNAVTIADAIAMRITGPTPGAVRTAMSRDRASGLDVPAVLGQRGTHNLFDPAELAGWEKRRRS